MPMMQNIWILFNLYRGTFAMWTHAKEIADATTKSHQHCYDNDDNADDDDEIIDVKNNYTIATDEDKQKLPQIQVIIELGSGDGHKKKCTIYPYSKPEPLYPKIRSKNHTLLWLVRLKTHVSQRLICEYGRHLSL